MCKDHHIHIVYESIGNPAYERDLMAFRYYKDAKAYAIKKNRGKWYSKLSQASPFFIRRIKMKAT